MIRPAFPALVTLLSSAVVIPAAELTLRGKTFTFPDDYILSEAALPPLVDRPIEADFDDKGRLYLTESSGSNEPVAEQLRKKPHRVLRLEDSDGDGVYDRRTIFADHLMFPAGCLWHEGALYVAAPPQIWRFTDADDDGVAEQRTVWFDGKTLTGCANDLHGPYPGPDKKIYWCKGAFAEQTYDLPGKPGWTTRAAHVFRADKGLKGAENIEPVFTAGMDNPVGLAWTPEGDLIVSGTFFQHPGGGQRDGLIHAVRGGVWGKQNDVLAGHPRTGALMPPMTHLGPAAPCGMIRYERDLLVCQFNLRKVSRHSLHPAGATYRTEDSDFLVCDHPDFHPTDVLQDPDGSVLIVDTGGWYKLCCPTSQLEKPQVLGAVYRMRHKGGEISRAVPAAQRPVVSEKDTPKLIAALTAEDPHLRREAAATLGRLRIKQAVPALLQALSRCGSDRFLFHAFTYALLEIGDPAATRLGFADAHGAVQAGVSYALAQMPDGKLTPAEVLPLVDSSDDSLAEACLLVIERNRSWAGGFIPWVRTQFAQSAGKISANTTRVVLALGTEPVIQELLGQELAAATQPALQTRLLEIMVKLRPDVLPPSWQAPLAKLLHQPGETEGASFILNILEGLPPAGRATFSGALTRLAAAPATSPGLRLHALSLLPDKNLDDVGFSFVLSTLDQPTTRAAAAALLSSRRFSPGQLRQLAARFPNTGVLERPLLLQAFTGATDEATGLALIESIEKSGALASIPAESLRTVFEKFPTTVQQALAKVQAAQTPADQAARLDDLEKNLPSGDKERGSVVFQSARASCSTCHPVGYKGGHLGPDLSKVGAIRTRRDLLEAIVYPHASFVRSYEPVLLTRQDDSVVYGIVTNQGAGAVTLAPGAAVPEVRVPQSEIKSIAPGKFSLMPEGLDRILTPQELADIITFLQSSH